MVLWLCALCTLLIVVCILLLLKIYLMQKAADEIRTEFAKRLQEDSNVQIAISSQDVYMRRLAADINQQLKLFRREQLRYIQGDQELKQAITSIAHDLRTPLTAICGYMELLHREKLSDEAERYLLIIENRISALKDMAEELFQFSVITSAEAYEERESVSLNRALEECLAGHYGALMAAGIEPVVILPDNVIYRELNKQALDRILQNIVSNVVKYSDGDFMITLEQDGSIHFQNHAEGLDEVKVGHLFDRFYTVESGRKSTGLGLAIAKKLTEEMGGKISARYQDKMLTIMLKL